MKPFIQLLVLVLVLTLLVEDSDAFWGRRRRRRRRSSCQRAVGSSRKLTTTKEVAKRLMEYSAAAYVRDRTLLEEWSCKLCRTKLRDFRYNGTAYNARYHTLAYIGYDTRMNAIVLTFRGSQRDVRNWLLVNFRIRKVRPSYLGRKFGKVHRGFYEAYRVLRGKVHRLVRNMINKYPSAKLIITGHSLGGALATLAAADLKVHGLYHSPIMVNFGSPMVGNRCFVNAYSNTVKLSNRFIHRRTFSRIDPVTILPAWGYRHVGRAVYDRDGRRHLTYFGQRPTNY